MIGTQIGGYRIIEHLADGGMGSVYVARHDLMHREAVVKVLLPMFSANQEIVRRFLNEARAATQIHHPGIVEIFDMGFLPTGQAYITMERLRGESLAGRFQRGPLTVEQTLALARQLGGALGAAHEAGIIHRDLKPDNLFLARDPSVRDPIVAGGERLKILDFGIAKIAQGGGGTFATVAGSIFGTPPYMSPEQCTSAGQVDRRSDLYSVGCILFEALCGKPPFGMGGIELIAAHTRDLPPRPRSLAPNIPPRVEAALLRLLEKDPADRPQSCDEMVSELNRATTATTTPIAPTVPAASERLPPVAVAAATPLSGQQLPIATEPTRRPVPKLAVIAFAGAVLLVAGVYGVMQVTGGSHASVRSAETRPVSDEPAVSFDAAPAMVAAAPRTETIEPLTAPPLDASSAGAAADPTPPPRALPVVTATKQVPDGSSKKNSAGTGTRVRTGGASSGGAAHAVDDHVAQACPDEVGCLLSDPKPTCCSKYTKNPGPKENVDTSGDKSGETGDDTRGNDLPESLDSGMIKFGVGKVKSRIFACGDKYPSAKGTLKLSVKVSADGAVTSATAIESPDPGLGMCVATAMEGATFPKTQRGGSFKYPFNF